MSYQNYQINFSFNGIATPAFVAKMSKEISKLTGCKTEVLSYLNFKIQDCALTTAQIKNILKDAYSIFKMNVSIKIV